MPLYRLLNKSDNFEWTDEADAALEQLKAALTSPPILAAPRSEEPMLLYVAATNLVVSVVLAVECKTEGSEISEQRPVYFVSEVFFRFKTALPTLPETDIRRILRRQKVEALFLGSFHLGCEQGTLG